MTEDATRRRRSITDAESKLDQMIETQALRVREARAALHDASTKLEGLQTAKAVFEPDS